MKKFLKKIATGMIQLKNMIDCPKCGFTFDADAHSRCPKCDYPV